jgi:peptidoglycan hydrolase-like protein with peptidoglycan-binding domain
VAATQPPRFVAPSAPASPVVLPPPAAPTDQSVEPPLAPPEAVPPGSAMVESVPARAATPLELKPGAIQMIEQRLESTGALALQSATGELGAATRAALIRFQEANELPPTGEVDEVTVRKLGLDPSKIFEPPLGASE